MKRRATQAQVEARRQQWGQAYIDAIAPAMQLDGDGWLIDQAHPAWLAAQKQFKTGRKVFVPKTIKEVFADLARALAVCKAPCSEFLGITDGPRPGIKCNACKTCSGRKVVSASYEKCPLGKW